MAVWVPSTTVAVDPGNIIWLSARQRPHRCLSLSALRACLYCVLWKFQPEARFFLFGDWRASEAVLDHGREAIHHFNSTSWAKSSSPVTPASANVGPRYETERLLLLETLSAALNPALEATAMLCRGGRGSPSLLHSVTGLNTVETGYASRSGEIGEFGARFTSIDFFSQDFRFQPLYRAPLFLARFSPVGPLKYHTQVFRPSEYGVSLGKIHLGYGATETRR